MVRCGDLPGMLMLRLAVFLLPLGQVAGDDIGSLMLTSPPVPTASPVVNGLLDRLPSSVQQVQDASHVPRSGAQSTPFGPQRATLAAVQQNARHSASMSSGDPLSTFVFSDLPMALGYLTGLALAGATLWACCRFCQNYFLGMARAGESRGIGRGGGAQVRRSDYEQVSASERDGLLCAPPPSGEGDGSSSGDDDAFGRSMPGAAVSPVLAPLREFGMVLKDKFIQSEFNFASVAGHLLPASAGVSCSRPGNYQDRDCSRDVCRGSQDSGDEEEVRGLLHGDRGDHEEDEPLLACDRVVSPLRSQPQQASRSPLARSRFDDEDDEDEAAVAALMKLRPAACDSVGGDEDEDELATRPLVGSERASFLSR